MLLLRRLNQQQHNRHITTLIIGSSGYLGKTITQHLKQKAASVTDVNNKPVSMHVIGADTDTDTETETTSDTKLVDDFVALPRTNLLENYVRALHRGLDGYDRIDAIICAAGGWECGNLPYDSIEEEAYMLYAKTTRDMLQQNLYPAVAASSVAASKLGEGGMFVAIGAAASLSPTPGMEGYGMSKAAVHHLIQSMGKESSVQPRKVLRQTYLGILPAMTDNSTWTDPNKIASEIGEWLFKPLLRPATGNLIKVTTSNKKGKTHFVLCR